MHAFAPLLLVSLLFSHSVVADTGCNMNADSDLMKCLGNYASIPPVAQPTDSASAQATFYCNYYSVLASCWAQGMYCREWLPMQTAADKFCAIASGALTADSTAAFPTATLASVALEASQVITSIWNNDSGTDIPIISQDLATSTRPTWTSASGPLVTFSTTAGSASTAGGSVGSTAVSTSSGSKVGVAGWGAVVGGMMFGAALV